jgi:hypothetical protein
MSKIPTPIIHHFREINSGQFSSVKHYELDSVKNGSTLLTEQLNISKDRKFARSNPEYWLKIKEGDKWSKPITGLFKTSTEDLYKGDCNYKKHLLIIRFTIDHSKVTAFYFQNFFTDDLRHVIPITQ